MTVYVSIGNSDDKLTQARWSVFWEQVNAEVRGRAREVYGDWMSLPSARWQNACIAFAIDRGDVGFLKSELREIAAEFGQDSIAWAEAVTEFLSPPESETASAP